MYIFIVQLSDSNVDSIKLNNETVTNSNFLIEKRNILYFLFEFCSIFVKSCF